MKRRRSPSICLGRFLCSFILSFVPCSAYRDPGAVQGLRLEEKPDASISFSSSLSASRPPLPSRALPLLTFENQNLEFEFQSELADAKQVWGGLRSESEDGEAVGLVGAAVIEKGPVQRVPRPPPSEGPRSIQTRSNKAFPLSSLQNTKQNRGRERRRRGRERRREGERGEKLFR